jgi:hypothetical protein
MTPGGIPDNWVSVGGEPGGVVIPAENGGKRVE